MFLIALLLLRAVAADISTVVFVADGVHDWTALETLLPRPKLRSLVQPSDAPESAACASEMATGRAGTKNQISPHGVPVGAAAKKKGARVGIVTDMCGVDPTVASFFVSDVNRFDIYAIAAQLSSVDVVIGGASRPLHCDDACCVTDRADLARSLHCKKLRGSFGNLRAALAAVCSPPDGQITLEDMTIAALSNLRALDAGTDFFLVVGGDSIDVASHSGNIALLGSLYSDFAAAVTTAVNYLAYRKDVRIIVTGDHTTVLNTTFHGNATVPILVYGAAPTDLPALMPQTRVYDVFPKRGWW